MNRIFFWALLLNLSVMSCQAEPSGEGKSGAEEKAVPAAEAPAVDENTPAVESSAFYTPPISNAVLQLAFAETVAKAGGTVCVDLKATQFTRLLSMQYTVAWDPAVLKLKEVANFGLPYLSGQNFGATRAAEGVMPVVWIDNALKGTTIPDGSTLYAVCFEVIGKAGQVSPLQIVDSPTAIEVVNLDEELVSLQPQAGQVSVE